MDGEGVYKLLKRERQVCLLASKVEGMNAITFLI